MEKMIIVDNKPTKKRRVVGFVERYEIDGSDKKCCVEEWYEYTYKVIDMAEGRDVRDIREDLGLNLRDAADKLGISIVELSRVELGKARFSDYKKAISVLKVGIK